MTHPRVRRAGGRHGRRCAPMLRLLEARTLLAGPGDVTAPVTALILNGVVGQDGYYRGPVNLTLAASDADDAPASLTSFVSVDGGPFIATTSRTLATDGVHTVAFYSVDPAGNAGAIKAQTVRIDATAPVVTAFPSRTSLWPPNGKLVPVTIRGSVADNLSGVVPTVSYRVVDEYGAVQPSGTAAVNASGQYSFTVRLPARRNGQDRDGRQFTVLVTATDQAGNTSTTATVITVPHDQGRHRGGGIGSNDNQGETHKNKEQHGRKGRGHGLGSNLPGGDASDDGQDSPKQKGNGRHGQGQGRDRTH